MPALLAPPRRSIVEDVTRRELLADASAVLLTVRAVAKAIHRTSRPIHCRSASC